MAFWKKLAAGILSPPPPQPRRGKDGSLAYAVGDVHGRMDLLEQMLSEIQSDLSRAPTASNFIVFLGDLIDRGPDSAGVIERLRTFRHPKARTIFLTGNHEEVLLRVLDGEPGLVEDWLRFGGSECVASYGLDPKRLKRHKESTAAEMLRQAMPAEHIAFLQSFGDTFRFGDYLFVHAGIRPGVPLEQQSRKDLRWIREPFLSDRGSHDFVVVHGHTVFETVEDYGNRIGIDTGAVYTGTLTALVIDGNDRRYLVARDTGGATDGERQFRPLAPLHIEAVPASA